jgi:hypothetical protein
LENRINRDDNRLGVAVQLCTLPWQGWIPDDLTGCPLATVARLAIALAIDPASRCVMLPRPGEQELIAQLAPAPADARAVRLGAKAAGAVLLAGS